MLSRGHDETVKAKNFLEEIIFIRHDISPANDVNLKIKRGIELAYKLFYVLAEQ